MAATTPVQRRAGAIGMFQGWHLGVGWDMLGVGATRTSHNLILMLVKTNVVLEEEPGFIKTQINYFNLFMG